jgi:60S ribosomal subunit assembly/export protein LOC1
VLTFSPQPPPPPHTMAPTKPSSKGKGGPKGKSGGASKSKSGGGKEPEGISKRKQKSMKLAKPGGAQKTKSKANDGRKKKRTYTEAELDIPKLNSIIPAGIAKPKGQKKGKVFVDDPASMLAIMSVVNAQKEGHIESKIMRTRQLEEIREAKRKEAEARADKKKEDFVSAVCACGVVCEVECGLLTSATGGDEAEPEEAEDAAQESQTRRASQARRRRSSREDCAKVKEEGFVRMKRRRAHTYAARSILSLPLSKIYDTRFSSIAITTLAPIRCLSSTPRAGSGVGGSGRSADMKARRLCSPSAQRGTPCGRFRCAPWTGRRSWLWRTIGRRRAGTIRDDRPSWWRIGLCMGSA